MEPSAILDLPTGMNQMHATCLENRINRGNRDRKYYLRMKGFLAQEANKSSIQKERNAVEN